MAAHSRRLEAKNDASVVSVDGASEALVAENRNRISVFLKNTHAAQTVSISLGGTAVAGEGIVLAPGEGIVITEFMGAINAIASGASTTVAVAEV